MSHIVLLDTHALLWYDTEPERIPEPVLGLLQRQGTHILVSAASVLELAIKFRLGKLPQQAAGRIRNHGALIQRSLPRFRICIRSGRQLLRPQSTVAPERPAT